MPLEAEKRKPDGTPAVIQSLKDFRTNFNIFSESSLADMDWSNVVAAGSSVVTSLLPVPGKYAGSKRALRQYYHEIIAPASDVDLFIYGLSEEAALEKIKLIERKVKDSILAETTTIRTKHAITIASQYPTRHVQIVLRIYKSVAEILTGFDVDCSCVAYDGNQVYASPRALAAYMTQVNSIDLTRRSPSYENRLSKYSRRGFEVYWPQLDRSKIDPTIFERNFGRTLGLARLLVLEKLPSSTDRDDYMDQRRRERGRPGINRWARASLRSLKGNIKDKYEDEVAEWVEEDEVADYHTFTVPYGEKFHARKIEKLLYTKDILLNAEWNKQKDREVNLHRHPAFFGDAEDVFYDCCGYCPQPETPEEEEVAEEEAKVFVSGNISFIKDDPGRQSIGSFNPLTDDDWTEMAYVGNTARLCQAIVDGDLEHVQDWLAQEGADPNCRDYTGRTPLHLACQSSTPEIVQCLVDAGARMVARVADGRTALHLAAARGSAEIVRILMKRSEANEEEEAKKADLRRKARLAAKEALRDGTVKGLSDVDMESEEDAEMVDADEDDDVDMKSTTTGSYVNVKKGNDQNENDNLPEDDEDDPDVYDINVLAWDTPSSALHLAIFNGHCEVVKELVQNFGADVLLPVKLIDSYSKRPSAAILSLCLAVYLPLAKAQEMVHTLLEIGASAAQADLHGVTAFHRFTSQQTELLQTLFDHDLPGAKRALNHLAVGGHSYNPSLSNPLQTAVDFKNSVTALKLLEMGARPEVGFQEFVDAWAATRESYVHADTERNQNTYRQNVRQPVLIAVNNELPTIVQQLLKYGADPNTLTRSAWQQIQQGNSYGRDDVKSLLDLVQDKLKQLRNYDDKVDIEAPEPDFEGNGQEYISQFPDRSYQQWVAAKAVQQALRNHKHALEDYAKRFEDSKKRMGLVEKRQAVEQLLNEFEEVEKDLVARGAKTFAELYPNLVTKKREHKAVFGRHTKHKHEPWKVMFGFRVPDLTEKKRDGYIKLFNAAWDGDLLAIKRLTLTFWGDLRDQFPLKIAVTDQNDLSPFHIAILRGHIDCAKGILEIAAAQYKPKEKEINERYTMDQDSDDESSQASEATEDESNIKVFREIVDDQFTIENIGEVSTQVRSNISPLAFFDWFCPIPQIQSKESNSIVVGLTSHPLAGEWERSQAGNLFQYAIERDDLDLLKTLLSWGADYTAQFAQTDDEQVTAPFYTRIGSDLDFALRRSRIRCLDELIKQTGIGLPLDKLVKESGIEIVEKPKYYQGLSIHGKKRADWAAAGRGVTPQRVGDEHPPVLLAAKQGSLEGIEWFLSDAPARCYAEFAENNKADKRLKHLAKANGGIQGAISDWLDLRQKLVLHCAILGPWHAEQTPKILDYLMNTFPKTIETKASSFGQTPLHLAFSLGRYVTAKKLIDAGADQTCRNITWNNIIHALLNSRGTQMPLELFKMLGLVDKRLLGSLLTERNSEGATPLSYWLRHWATDSSGEILKHLLSLSPSLAELDMVDGAGDTPLHIVIKRKMPSLMGIILDKRPEMLYRENATGRTPAEMAEDSWTSKCFQNPPFIPNDPSRGHYYGAEGSSVSLVTVASEKFLPKKEGSGEDIPTTVWDVCRERLEKGQKAGGIKRKLVSLNEANEVARRLGKKQKRAITAESQDEDSDHETDEVACWSGPSWCEFTYDKEGNLVEQ
ncbi:hypothetical protein MPH_11200 [Macrophomina phaseolina MS6]|uniref:Ankyrin repeat protein n=1 Tax=Macrophomina phaseolina (strain MS6) TaxID=1126212 RepID=K2RFP8_MACPH|nr:hypothetical protein MPH_11200 [Macrophomina phaseolina MS6]